jgi:hypothetical protein
MIAPGQNDECLALPSQAAVRLRRSTRLDILSEVTIVIGVVKLRVWQTAGVGLARHGWIKRRSFVNL